MAGMAVSVSMGVMNPLLAKLATLMGDEYKKLKGVRNQVSFLKDELTTMSAFLEKLALMDDELDPLAKDWRDHVREMAYDMEDCIDDFMSCLGDGVKEGFIKKTVRHLKTLRVRHQISNQIDKLKARVIETNERRMRYKLDDFCNCSASVHVTVDRRISALFHEAASLVGIDGPRKELLEWLIVPEQQVKVVSIVGFGGLGKTTLAKAVYDKIGDQFDCKTFVSVSQRPDMARLLTSIQSNLGLGGSAQADCQVQDIISVIRDDLKQKRYIIVVDDLWDQEAWNIIRCAFPENGNGSRVIVTTRLEDVAGWACGNHQYVYKMKPLNDDDSRSLFLKRIFGSENDCPSQYRDVSTDILKKCGGLPLAISTISGLLASRPSRIMEEWESIRNSLGSQFGRSNPSLEGMRKILNLSYKHLPLHLRTCLLYLGKYPEDHEIMRDELINQWVAEGFVIGNSHGQDLDDIGKNYFNELINRGLIQPVECDGEVLCCRVHDMMLDLILSKCAEDNFISVAYGSEDYMGSLDGPCKVRWLSINSISRGATKRLSRTTIEPEAIPASLAHARSVALFGMSMGTLPILPSKHLRVLYIEMSTHSNRMDLTVISQMLQLRYLSVKTTSVIELSSRICGLVHLEKLIIYGPETSLPSDVFSLSRLSHLIVPYGTMLPGGVGNMRSLRTIMGFKLLNMDIKSVHDLGELTNLRDLRLCSDSKYSATITAALGSSIAKLPNLRILEIHNINVEGLCDADCLVSLCDIPARGIEKIILSGWRFSRVPRWMNAHLHSLRSLNLDVQKTSTDEIGPLGELPSLVQLGLEVFGQYDSRAALEFGGTSSGPSLFPALERLCFICNGDTASSRLVFHVGVMPQLRELDLRFLYCDPGVIIQTPVGVEHLLSLRSIKVLIIPNYDKPPADDHPWDQVEGAFRDAAQAHPNRPSFAFEFRG